MLVVHVLVYACFDTRAGVHTIWRSSRRNGDLFQRHLVADMAKILQALNTGQLGLSGAQN